MFENQAVDADVTQALLHRIEQVLSGRGFELGAVGIGVTDRFDVQLLLFHVDIEGSRYPMNILVGGKLGQAAAILEDQKAGAAHDGLRTRCGLEQCLKLLTFRFPEQV